MYPLKEPAILSPKQIEARANLGHLLRQWREEIRAKYKTGDQFMYEGNLCTYSNMYLKNNRFWMIDYINEADPTTKDGRRKVRSMGLKNFRSYARKCQANEQSITT